MSVTSVPRPGTDAVSLSREAAPCEPGDAVMAPSSPADTGPTNPVILIAEDHPDSRDALQTLLQVHGYRVTTAADGREAVERAAAEVPDLILMDIMMPIMDGFEATRTLRAEPRFDGVPIIALTAMDGARELVLAAGCDDYLAKPIDIRTFLARIAAWLRSGRGAE
jgi:CheY-like chemotaxis protein